MTKMEIVEEKKSGAWKVILAIFLTAVIIGGAAGAGAFFWQQMEIDNQKSDKEQLSQDKDSLTGKIINLEGEVKNYETKEETASEKSLELTQGTLWLDAYVGALYCVGDPYVNGVVKSNKNENISYFATSTTSSTVAKDELTCVAQGIEEIDTKNSITKVYAQNNAAEDLLNAGHTKEIFSGEREGKTYHLIGIEGDKLIFADWNSDVDNSPGACSNMWTEENTHYYLDLNDTSAGMQAYTMLDGELLKQEKKKVEKCNEATSS